MKLFLIVLIAVTLLLSACAPAAVPTSAPIPTAAAISVKRRAQPPGDLSGPRQKNRLAGAIQYRDSLRHRRRPAGHWPG